MQKLKNIPFFVYYALNLQKNASPLLVCPAEFPLKPTTLGGLCKACSSCIFLLFTSKAEMFCNYMSVWKLWKQYFKYYQAELGCCEVATCTERCLTWTPSVQGLKLYRNVKIVSKMLNNSATLAHAARAPELFIFLRVHFDSYTLVKLQGFDSLFFSAKYFTLWWHEVETMSFFFFGRLALVIFVQAVHHKDHGDMYQDSEWSPHQSHSHLMLPTWALTEGAWLKRI